MHLELILNAVNINFVTFSDFFDSRQLKGNIFSIFVIAIAAAEEILGIMNFRLKQDQYSE